jgi:hypothetical protein
MGEAGDADSLTLVQMLQDKMKQMAHIQTVCLTL